MTLTHPWFLLGLLALVIPLLLHLFELRRPQRVQFTNVDFIKEVKLVTAKQRRLQHLLVLLLRLGFVVFLVLLFCQPFLPAADADATASNTGAALVLDNTLSMSAESADGLQLLEKGVSDALQLIDALPRSASYDLISGDVRQSSITPQRVKEALTNSFVSGSGQNIVAQTAWLANRNRAAKPTSVFLISDFQRSGFDPAIIKRFSNQQVYLFPIRSAPAGNIYVDSLYLADEFIRSGADLSLQLRFRNGGNQDANSIGVRVMIADRQVGTFQLSLPAGQSVTNTVRVRLNGTTAVKCRVEVEDQPVRFDNAFYFVLRPTNRIRVLEIGSSQSPLRRLYPNEAVFSYREVRVGEFQPELLSNADLVVVNAATGLRSEQRAALKRFAESGGAILLLPVASGGGASFNEALADLGLTTVQIRTGSQVGASQELAPPDKQNPFFRDVFAEQTRQLDMPRATPLLSWSRSSLDVLKFRDGSPFISGFRSGTGMIYVVAAPLVPAYTSFTEHPLFVPVMYRLATSSINQDQLPAYRLSDRTVVLRQPVASAQGKEQVYKLANDSSSFIPAQQTRDGRLYLQLPPDLRQPGYYSLTLDDQAVGSLAFNADKKESELSYYSTEELRQLETTYPNVHVYESAGGQSVAAQFTQQRAGTPLWRYCLAAALLCLLGEVLVLRFARSKNAAMPVAT
ncbi:BatA domain-containing protein [Solirubrum puertoriconensis]|uniref:BatA domain-containing protein n=1 Tax=Solirubrum puertoriconensis TaxID=1751427 RepID=UPI00098F5638|nr:BatA domain-containing protein [Solirubrum puertoriconensis]